MTRRTVLVHARGRMIEAECAFWDAVGDALLARGAELRLITHNIIKGSMRAAHAQVPNGLDAIAPIDGVADVAGWLDVDSLLAQETRWRGRARDGDHEAQRVRAIGMYARLYESMVSVCKPDVCVIWNGHHPQEMVLRRVCERHGVPTMWVERGPMPGTLQLDDVGVLGGSSVVRERGARPSNAEWVERARRFAGRLSRSAWEQPERMGGDALRLSLGIGERERVAFFAGQVDADVQGFLYGSGCTNAEAFGRFVEAMSEQDDVFILGKHHPRSGVSPERYREELAGRRGAWVEDVSVRDCLEVCDRVASVNSTVLYEALCASKPVMSMGLSLLSGKGIAYRFGVDRAEDWLEAHDAQERHERWIEYLACLLEHHLCVMGSDKDASPLHGATWFAVRALGWASEYENTVTDTAVVGQRVRDWTGFGAIGGTGNMWPELFAEGGVPREELASV